MQSDYMEHYITVSIITVAYNSEKTIWHTIESILEQTYPPDEYIIVDGKSIDKTVEIAEKFREKFEKKKVEYKIISEPDYGMYDAMNKGIRNSTGELIGIINSDDWYEKNTVEIIVQKYRDTNYDLVFGDIYMVRPNGNYFIKKAKKSKYVTSRYWNHPTQFVHRRVYDRFMYRCENISDDMDFYFRTIREGYHIEVINEVLADFQIGGVSNRIVASEIIPRIKRRYCVYRNNGFSRGYIFECIVLEILKYLLIKIIKMLGD